MKTVWGGVHSEIIVYNMLSYCRIHRNVYNQALLKPIYTPSSAGYTFLIDITTQGGQIFLFPLPNFLYLHKIYWRYATFLELLVDYSGSSALKSHLPLIAIINTSRSRQVFWNVTYDAVHLILPQHLFSSSVGMGRHIPHLHQDGFDWGSIGGLLQTLTDF